MTTQDLETYLVINYGYTSKTAATVIRALFNRIRRAIVDGERVHLTNFGTFKSATRAARKGRNPRTGEEIDLPESMHVMFRQCSDLKRELNP